MSNPSTCSHDHAYDYHDMIDSDDLEEARRGEDHWLGEDEGSLPPSDPSDTDDSYSGSDYGDDRRRSGDGGFPRDFDGDPGRSSSFTFAMNVLFSASHQDTV